MKKNSRKAKTDVQVHSNLKEQENATATSLSSNLDEAVEKSLAKSSSDEARSTSR
jgi:hypothetical protein